MTISYALRIKASDGGMIDPVVVSYTVYITW